MSTPVVDERTHSTVLQALLVGTVNAAEEEPARVFDYGTVPGLDDNDGVLPDIYVVTYLERRYVPPFRAGRPAVTGWRVVCRYVGRDVDEARWAANQVAEALDGITITVGDRTALITFETNSDIEPDEGRYSGSSSWTYAL